MSGLHAGDAIAADGATAPRVSLADMEARIRRAHIFTVGEAIAALKMPGTPELDIQTLCVLVLDNGWVLIGKSAPASPENFDAAKGAVFAREDAMRQLWPLEGYLLRNRLAGEDHVQE
jgi:hypothetical protein